MILRKISDTSIVIAFYRYFYRWYSRVGQSVSYIYHNSQTCKLAKGFWGEIKICLRYSFLGRITEPKQTTSGVLDTSRVVQHLIIFLKRWKDKVTRYLRTSLATMLAKDIKKDIYFSPVRIASIIAITAITVNVFLSVVLQKQIGLWGWLMQGLFLFGAVLGLFCKADWPTVKRSSVLLKKMRMD